MNKSAQRGGQRKWKGPEKSPDHKTVAKNGCITTVAKYTEKERKYSEKGVKGLKFMKIIGKGGKGQGYCKNRQKTSCLVVKT